MSYFNFDRPLSSVRSYEILEKHSRVSSNFVDDLFSYQVGKNIKNSIFQLPFDPLLFAAPGNYLCFVLEYVLVDSTDKSAKEAAKIAATQRLRDMQLRRREEKVLFSSFPALNCS